MQKLSFIILLFISGISFAQSPHGSNFDIDCEECHSTDKWDIDYEKLSFNHSVTEFELAGQHKVLDCRTCHSTIVFSDIDNQCSSCHTDIHQNSVGPNCDDCHTSQSWLVKNINELHLVSRFPLEGRHKQANCIDCHSSVNNLVFEPLGVECIDCHLVDYQAAKQPDHIAAGFSNDCQDCHQITDSDWSKVKVTHDFFPLVGGHNLSNCFDCHNQNSFEGLTQDCFTCHQNDFNATTDPNHISAGFTIDCVQCHTTNPDWKPASFGDHDNFFQLVGAHKLIENDCNKCHETGYSNTPDQCYDCHLNNYNSTTNPNHQSAGFETDCESCHTSVAWQPASFDHDNQFFPIYSGKHNNEWNECSDCHTNTSNYQVFSCITCHEHNQADMNKEHDGINGYAYESSACFACHPNGDGEGGFNHSTTNFPLTGVHITSQCNDCHTNGYEGTSSECSDCHTNDFQNSTNPNHQQLDLALNCMECHTTNPDWQPASFAVHNDFYLIEGAHTAIANDCSSCHSGNYNNTGDLCNDCHNNDYLNTSNPNHQSTGFGTDCEECHTQNAWEPATFDHDNQFFPIYSGKHNNEWNECSDCHTNSSNYQVFECITCHEHNQTEMDDKHQGVQGYLYLSVECLACHPTGDEEGAFNHSASLFPLTGAHTLQECSSCHQNGYANTSTECAACHQNDFNNSIDPNHIQAGIENSCEECHSSASWKPSSFNHVTTGFELVGGHNLTQCSDCHSVNTANATAECFICHESNYNSAEEHLSRNYPKTCEDCHNTTNWESTTFDHNNTNFALTGSHTNTECSDCHNSGYVGTSTLCFDCHQTDFNNSINPNHSQAGISHECEDCHSTNNWNPSSFNHTTTGFELVGGHNLTQCSDCHSVSTANATSECFICHESNYNSADEHLSQNYPKTCEDCHNTTNWENATFDHNNTNFALTGSHTNANCGDCHTSGYYGTSTVCSDCHISEFNNSSNPNHSNLGLSINCENCHTTNPNWQPASFSVHNDFYLIQGAHTSIENDCSTCHNSNYNNTPDQCYGCHQNNYTSTTNPPHQTSGFGTDCEDCHSQNAWEPSTFDHDGQYFPIYSGKHREEWNNCSDCHTNQSDFSNFSCLECHEHNQSKMDDKHKEEDGYAYLSTACYDCHPNGKSD